MQWQPIETAPKDDETLILACVAGSKIPMPTGWDDGWYTINNAFKNWQPTHWMPLPVPPDREVWTQEEIDEAEREAKDLSQFLNFK